jgi:RNA polymerase sigma-70 factor, ECF subfamily
MTSHDVQQQFLDAFDAHADALVRHGFYRLGDREKALDAVQDTFTKTWEYLVKGGDVHEYRAFLYRTLNNLIVDEYRKKRAVSLDALLNEETVTEGSFADLKTGGLEELTETLDARLVLKELPHLPESYREVITMRYIDELGPKEIAEILGERENVISVRIHRALKWLRTRMEQKL